MNSFNSMHGTRRSCLSLISLSFLFLLLAAYSEALSIARQTNPASAMQDVRGSAPLPTERAHAPSNLQRDWKMLAGRQNPIETCAYFDGLAGQYTCNRFWYRLTRVNINRCTPLLRDRLCMCCKLSPWRWRLLSSERHGELPNCYSMRGIHWSRILRLRMSIWSLYCSMVKPPLYASFFH